MVGPLLGDWQAALPRRAGWAATPAVAPPTPGGGGGSSHRMSVAEEPASQRRRRYTVAERQRWDRPGAEDDEPEEEGGEHWNTWDAYEQAEEALPLRSRAALP